MTARQIASSIILKYADKESGINNLKLQSVLYYVQLFSLAKLKKVAFDDAIEAWQHGAYVREIYFEFKCYRRGNIPLQEFQFSLPSQLDKVVDDIVNRTFCYDSLDLMKKAQQTPAWKEYYVNSHFNAIPVKAMAKPNINILWGKT